jgi:hypothetical protein
MKTILRTAIVLGLAIPLSACDPDEGSGPGPDAGDTGDSARCSSTTPYCSSDGRYLLQCSNTTGLSETIQTCYPDNACVGGACVAASCPPNNVECLDGDTMQRCRVDGSGWDTTDCDSGTSCNVASGLCEAQCRMRLFVLVDSSGSMTEGTPTKWEQASDAMQSILESPTAADIEWGLGKFPTDNDCAVDAPVIYPVPEATASEINSYFSANSPSGNTPLISMFQSLVDDTEANIKDETYHNGILVISDGVDTCFTDCMTPCAGLIAQPLRYMNCITACENDAAPAEQEALVNAVTTLRDTYQVRTFVIGFAAAGSDSSLSPEQLSAIATNGGTGMDWIEAGNEDELMTAIQAIVDEMWECNPILR